MQHLFWEIDCTYLGHRSWSSEVYRYDNGIFYDNESSKELNCQPNAILQHFLGIKALNDCIKWIGSNHRMDGGLRKIELLNQYKKLCKMEKYMMRFPRNSSVLIFWVILWWWVNLATCLFLISSLVEDYCESLGRGWVVDIPFTKFWLRCTLFLWKIKISYE